MAVLPLPDFGSAKQAAREVQAVAVQGKVSALDSAESRLPFHEPSPRRLTLQYLGLEFLGPCSLHNAQKRFRVCCCF